jgi:hypothetical protein
MIHDVQISNMSRPLVDTLINKAFANIYKFVDRFLQKILLHILIQIKLKRN